MSAEESPADLGHPSGSPEPPSAATQPVPRPETPPGPNYLLSLNRLDEMREMLRTMEDDSLDDEDALREVVLNKKYAPVEIQEILNGIAERSATAREEVVSLKAAFKEVLNLQKADHQLALERQQHLETHGSSHREQQLVNSSELLDAVNDLVKVFWNAHKAELPTGGAAVTPKLSRKDKARAQGIEVSHKKMRYAVSLLFNKENRDADKRYRIPFVKDQHMLQHDEWPVHVASGSIQKNVYDEQAGKVVAKIFYRPNLRNLEGDTKSQEFLQKATAIYLASEPQAMHDSLEGPVIAAIKGHCQYGANKLLKRTQPDPEDEEDEAATRKADLLRLRETQSKKRSRRTKRSNAIAAGRVSAYPKSPYIRCLEASELKWLTQPELAPRIVSEDEDDAYPVVSVAAPVEDSEEDGEEDGEEGTRTTKVSGWTYYQRLNNNGQRLTKKDGTMKVMYEARHLWVLKDRIIRHLEVLDWIHRDSLGPSQQMNETWTGPRWAWRNDSKALPDIRPKLSDGTGRPDETPGVEGVVIFQHWLSPEILSSRKKEHVAWVKLCYPTPIHVPNPSGLTNNPLDTVVNSKRAWTQAYANASRLVDPLQPVWSEEVVRAALQTWSDEDAAEERAAQERFEEY